MALITLQEAATLLGIPSETIGDWVERGLLTTQRSVRPSNLPPGSTMTEDYVEQEQLIDVAEGLGWLQLSTESWDDDEDH